MLHHLQHTHHDRFVETERRDLVDGHVFFDERFENRVEHRVIGQRVAVFLLRPEFRRRLPRDRSLGYRVAERIAVTRKTVDERLVAVFYRREAARHVAVERRITDRHLALVAGREQHAAGLVGYRHQDHAAAARLDIFFRDVGFAAGEDRCQLLHRRIVDRCDRHDVIPETHRLGLPGGIFLADRARVAERHHDRPDLVGADRVAGDGGNQRRIDAA